MSSILKALKKLENEAQPPAESTTGNPVVDVQKSISRKVRHQPMKFRWLLVIIEGMIIVVGGWFIIQSYTQSRSQIESLPEPIQVKTQPLSQPTVVIAKPSPSISIKDNPTNQMVPPIPLTVSDRQGSEKREIEFSNKKKVVVIKEPDPVEKPLQQKKPSVIQVPVDDEIDIDEEPEARNENKIEATNTDENDLLKEPEVTDENKTEATNTDENDLLKEPEDSYGSEKRLQDGRLRIQALVWSKDPKTRFVVINDRIIHTGSLINDEFVVTHIDSDFVIVQEGDQRWRLDFQIK